MRGRKEEGVREGRQKVKRGEEGMKRKGDGEEGREWEKEKKKEDEDEGG